MRPVPDVAVVPPGITGCVLRDSCDRVLSEHTLGESVRQARGAIRGNPGDPTWPAYIACGDLAATMSLEPGQTD